MKQAYMPRPGEILYRDVEKPSPRPGSVVIRVVRIGTGAEALDVVMPASLSPRAARSS